MEQIKSYTMDQWNAEGVKRFGENVDNWLFVCPKCKTIQSVKELKEVTPEGEDWRSYIAFSCIGRFNKEKKGCNWTLGGLFRIHTAEIVHEKSIPRPIFEFAEE